MKNFLLLCWLFVACIAQGQNIVSIKISKPYCLFNFMQSASGNARSISPTLQAAITENLGKDAAFAKLVEQFKDTRLHYNFSRDDYPSGRRTSRSTLDLLNIALVNSDNLDQFASRAIGILPNTEYEKLISTLKAAEPFYDKAIWNNHKTKLEGQKIQLNQFVPVANELFKNFRAFYGSSWSADIPFIVSLYPIPGKSGNSAATPHANSLCVGVLTNETAHAERMGVILHEMCHVLYDEQPAAFQHEIQKWFDENPSQFAPAAYTFFDEAMATALGNGFAYKKMRGKMDETEWYNNPYINGFAKALYPMAESYLESGKTLDKNFIDSAIAIFEKTFPDSLTDYGILFNRSVIYTDVETPRGRDALLDTIEADFRLSGFSLSSPVLDPISLEMMRDNPAAQFIIIDRDFEKTFGEVVAIYPELKSFDLKLVKNHALVSVIDSKKRPVTLLISRTQADISGLVKQMKKMGSFDKNKLLQFAD